MVKIGIKNPLAALGVNLPGEVGQAQQVPTPVLEEMPSEPGEVDPLAQAEGRARHMASGQGLASLLHGIVNAVKSTDDGVGARSATGAENIHDILNDLGLETGADKGTLEDPTTKNAIKRVQEQFGLPLTGELDAETLLAILQAQMARDRRSAPAASSSPSAQGRMNSGSGVHGTRQPAGGGNPPDISSEPLKKSQSVDTSNWKPGKGDVTPDELRRIAPNLTAERAAEIAPHLNRAMAEAGIDTPQRKAAFIAQLAHESGGFKYMEEIASGRQYEGRRDLGNTQPGDGERFKGRGFIQVTGRANYTAASKALGEDFVNHPERAGTLENAARIAAWYWNSRGLNGLADQGNFDGITKRINGGFNGKADRDQYFARALDVLRNSDGSPSTGVFA